MPWNTSLDRSPSSSRALRHERLMLLLEKKIYFGEIKANVTFGEKKKIRHEQIRNWLIFILFF
jgi:tryptophanyl-tRNA synthetase